MSGNQKRKIVICFIKFYTCFLIMQRSVKKYFHETFITLFVVNKNRPPKNFSTQFFYPSFFFSLANECKFFSPTKLTFLTRSLSLFLLLKEYMHIHIYIELKHSSYNFIFSWSSSAETLLWDKMWTWRREEEGEGKIKNKKIK